MDTDKTEMQDTAAPIDSYAFAGLVDPDMPGQVCSRRTRIQLDWMLLALEALDLNATENIIVGLHELQLQPVIKNRVHLWQLRNTNPLRRFSQRQSLSLTEGKALVVLTCYLARRQTGTIRQLLRADEQLKAKSLSADHHFRLAQYLERFRGHFFSRMNANRTAIAPYKSSEALNELALGLLGQALFCTGIAGIQRLWSSLFDGEVA
jgi:Protein of unknown function (DUF3038)